MYKLEKYFKSPFKDIKVSKDLQVEFYNVHVLWLKMACQRGEPFTHLIADSEDASTKLAECTSKIDISFAHQQGRTLNVQNIINSFISMAIDVEVYVRIYFKKKSAGYVRFFPRGKTQYFRTNNLNALEHMTQILTAMQENVDKMGQEKVDEFANIYNQYTLAREEQLQAMTDTKYQRQLFKSSLKRMQDQSFKNMLTISAYHINKPERAKTYFDTSILLRSKHHKKHITKE